MEFLKLPLFVILPIVFGYWLTGRKWLEREIERNDNVEPPSSRQLRWDIRHMREDLHVLVLINCVLLYLFFWFVVYFKAF